MFGGASFAGAPFADQGSYPPITATVSATLTTSGTIDGTLSLAASVTSTLSTSGTIAGAVSITASASASLSASASIDGTVNLSASVVSTLAFIGTIDGTLDEFHPRSYIVLATRAKYTVIASVRAKYTITITEIPPMSQDIGDITEVTFTIKRTSDDALTDPTGLVVTIRTPSGTETSFTYGTSSELTKVSTGTYMLSYTPTESGIHSGRIQATGAAVAAEPFDFRVNNQKVGV